MKSIKLAVAVLVVFLMIPVSSYALIDAGAYGGYSYANLEQNAFQKDVSGWEYGAFGHLNTGIPLLFTIGLGGFYHVNNSTMDLSGSGDVDVERSMYGLDAMFTLELPLLPVNPFVRAGIAINESFEIKQPGSEAEDEKFKSYFFAAGVGYSVFPMTSLFLEYMYNISNRDDDVTISTHSIQAGVMINIGL